MLRIRDEQMKVFEKVALRSFEDEMVQHIRKFAPRHSEIIGEEGVRQVVKIGIERAKGYGLTNRGPVRFYIELMFMLGSDFDTDPQYPWAAEILRNQDSAPQMQRAEMLYEKTMDYREKVAGPEDAYTLKALRNISVLVRQPVPLSSESLIPAMRQEITRVYPQKAAYVGDEGLEALIREGNDGARSHRFSTVHEVALLIVLMLAFGHGCGDDPLYPWIARTLQDEAIADPEARAKNLGKKAVTWLEHILANFDKAMKT